MKLEEFRDELEAARDGDLLRYVQRCLCISLTGDNSPKAESQAMLDLLYAECARRGKERLYDKAYETVCRKPDVCKVLLA